MSNANIETNYQPKSGTTNGNPQGTAIGAATIDLNGNKAPAFGTLGAKVVVTAVTSSMTLAQIRWQVSSDNSAWIDVLPSRLRRCRSAHRSRHRNRRRRRRFEDRRRERTAVCLRFALLADRSRHRRCGFGERRRHLQRELFVQKSRARFRVRVMSFTRVGPNGGWPVNGTLTSAQLNALDIDHANAVDRSIAGDTVAGLITLDGPEASLILPATTITGAGSTLRTANGGRIVLGANDWVQYSTPRTFQRCLPFLVQPGAAFIAWDVDNNQSAANVSVGMTGNVDISDFVVDGSVLTAIEITFFVSSGHSGFTPPPAVMPKFTLFQQAGIDITDLQASIATGTIPTPASGSAWYNGGAIQSYTLIVPSLTIDNAGASYYLQVTDENGTLGTDVATGNIYQSLQITFSCADMRPR